MKNKKLFSPYAFSISYLYIYCSYFIFVYVFVRSGYLNNSIKFKYKYRNIVLPFFVSLEENSTLFSLSGRLLQGFCS